MIGIDPDEEFALAFSLENQAAELEREALLLRQRAKDIRKMVAIASLKQAPTPESLACSSDDSSDSSDESERLIR